MIGLLLSGGGAKGVWQYEQIHKLLQTGYTPDVVFGTSVGALHAALLCTGQIYKGEHIWKNIENRKVYKWSLYNIFFTDGFYSYKPLESMIKEHLINKTVHIPFAVTVVNRRTKNIAYKFFTVGEVITKQSYKWILASAIMPVIWPSIKIENEYYVDGGVVDNLPVGNIINMGVTDITGILTENPFIGRSEGKIKKGISGKLSNLGDTLSALSAEVLKNDLATVKYHNTSPKPHHKLIKSTILYPEIPLPFGPMDFNRASQGTKNYSAESLNLSDPRL